MANNIKKCPFCGAALPVLADKCPDCGHFLTAEVEDNLDEIVNQLENALSQVLENIDLEKNLGIIDRYSRKARLFYGDDPKISRLLAEIEQAKTKASKEIQKKTLHKNIVNKGVKPVLFILLAIVCIVGGFSVYKYINGRPDNNALVCSQLIERALKDKDLTMAESYASAYLAKHNREEIELALGTLANSFFESGEYAKAMYYDSNIASKIVNKAVKENNLEQAEEFLNDYIRKYGEEDIKSSVIALYDAYYSQGDLYKALSIVTGGHQIGPSDASPEVMKVQKKFISLGQYDDAEMCINYTSRDKEYYDFLCSCLDDLISKGKSGDCHPFIIKKCKHFANSSTSNYSQDIVEQRLLDYVESKITFSGLTDESPANYVGVRNFTGSIDTYPVHVTLLFDGNKVKGRCYYDRQRSKGNMDSVKLYGDFDGINLTLYEYYEPSVTGEFIGTMVSDNFTGKFIRKKDGKEMPFIFNASETGQNFFSENDLSFSTP
mgnify:CR=1 FL=1